MVYELLCNFIGSSTSRLSLHILLVVRKKTNKVAFFGFAKVNEQEIRELLQLDNTTPKIQCLSI